MKLGLKKSAGLIALIVAMGLGATAHATEGWYVRGDVGYSFDGSLDLDSPNTGPLSLNGDASHDDDWMGSLGLGYAYQSGFRLEGETSYRANDLEPFASTAGSLTSGSTKVWAAMINGYYDFNKGGKIQPYLGLGLGYASVDAEAHNVNEDFDDKDSGFAYQAMAGVAFPLTQQLTLDIGYRYFAVPDLEYDGLTDGTIPTTFSADYDHHAATIGLRWQFAAPVAAAPPAPPPEPAPVVQVCPAQDFKVYFEWDKSALNAAASDTIRAAAERAKACNVSTVNVKGYTDTSGSAKYNVGLSNRRAAVVHDALVSNGIPASLITTEALGETNLDKATADGVKEPLNRRAAVTISFQ